MWVFVIVVAIVAALLLGFRLAPSDPAVWHVDPRTGEPGTNRFVVNPEGGDIPGTVYAETPEALLARFDAIALETPRTTRLAGSVAEGRITYLTRSLVFGFPDYTSVETVADGDGARLLIFARSRFGKGDMGVNRKRVTGWLDQLQGQGTS